ncbi:MAG: hydrolase [Spirochaetota bacterium]
MKNKNIISPENSILIVIDVQEKLLPTILDHKITAENISKLIRGCKVHNVPIIYTEQYKKGLGETVEVVSKELSGIEPIEKMEFSCFQNDEFKDKLKEYKDVKNLIICGIEAHVCVLQTSLDAIEDGYNVHIVKDAISSRKAYDYNTGIEKMKMCGVFPTTVEIALFELTNTSKSPEFKEISKIVKEFTQEKKIGF